MLEVNIFNKVSHEFLQALVNSQHTCIKNSNSDLASQLTYSKKTNKSTPTTEQNKTIKKKNTKKNVGNPGIFKFVYTLSQTDNVVIM